MLPLEKVALAVRVAGFPKFASAYIRACGEEAPENWDLQGSFTHLGTKIAAQVLSENEVNSGVKAAGSFADVKVAAAPLDFTSEFHAVNRLASGLDKTASVGAVTELSERRVALWGAMKEAAERTPDVLMSLTKTALRVWSETSRMGEKTASTRAEREAFALAFASNYLVDTKIASMYEANEISRVDAVKLAHISAEAALEDLSGVVKTASKKAAGPEAGAWDVKEDASVPHGQFSHHIEGEDEFGNPMWWLHVNPKHLQSLSANELERQADKYFRGANKTPARAKTAMDPRLIGMGLGAAVGVGAGAMSDKDNRWRGAGMGALFGIPTGLLGGQIASELMSHGAPDRRAGEIYEKLRVYADKIGNGIPQIIEQHKGDIIKSGKAIPAALMQALSPGDVEQLVKLDKIYNGGVFGKTAELGTPGAVAPPPAQSQTPVGVSPPGGGMNADAQRKGMDGFSQLVSYGQAIGNGFPEMIQQNKDSIIQHFAEGKKHMPPQLTAQLGPGVIDQVLELKKRMQAPII